MEGHKEKKALGECCLFWELPSLQTWLLLSLSPPSLLQFFLEARNHHKDSQSTSCCSTNRLMTGLWSVGEFLLPVHSLSPGLCIGQAETLSCTLGSMATYSDFFLAIPLSLHFYLFSLSKPLPNVVISTLRHGWLAKARQPSFRHASINGNCVINIKAAGSVT